MILRWQSPSKKLEPSAPVLLWMLRPSAPQLSRKPRPPAPALSGKPKLSAPQPSGMLTPGGPPRLSHSTGIMPRPSNTWRNKSSKKKVRVRSTFSLPIQAALQASPAELNSALVASYHILMGHAPMSHPFTLSQGASPTKQLSVPAAPPSLVPEHSPRPKRRHPSAQTLWTTCLLAGPCPRQPWKGPQLQVVRGPTLVQGTQTELLRSTQPGHQFSEGG